MGAVFLSTILYVLFVVISVYMAGNLLVATLSYMFYWYEVFNNGREFGHDPELPKLPSDLARICFYEWLVQAIIYLYCRIERLGFLRTEIGANLANEKPPVLFVHGWLHSPGGWRPLMAKLASRRKNRRLFTVDLAPAFRSIPDYAQTLHLRIEEVRRLTGHAKVVLVGHSMGGLIIREYLATRGVDKVERVAALGSPFAGTTLGAFSFSRDARQMTRNSDYLQTLAKDESYKKIPFKSIYSVHDNLVIPFWSSRLDGADNIALGEMGHSGLLWDEGVAAVLEGVIYED